MVPNGSRVKKGQLLVRLDSSAVRERLTRYQITLIRALSYQIRAHAQYENQKSKNRTRLADAQLDLKLARLALQQYKDPVNGQRRVRQLELDLGVHTARDRMLAALAGLAIERTNRDAIARLYRLGYRRRIDYDRARIAYLRQENELVSAANDLARALARRQKFLRYEDRMELAELEAEVTSAEQKLLRVERQNAAELVEAEAFKTERDRRYDRYRRLVERYETWLKNCEIYAPHDGIVVAARRWVWWRRALETVREGSYVYYREPILSLPDLTKMEVEINVHETALRLIREGLPATIRVDAFPDRTYHGRVKSVAALPDRISRLESEVKTFQAVVTVDEPNPGLRPGMTALVEIDAGVVPNVLTVPVQAVAELEGQYFCLVKGNDGLEQRAVTIGQANDFYVEVRGGLRSGEQVVLDPLPLLDLASRTGSSRWRGLFAAERLNRWRGREAERQNSWISTRGLLSGPVAQTVQPVAWKSLMRQQLLGRPTSARNAKAGS